MNLLKLLGVGVMRYEKLERLRQTHRHPNDLEFLRSLPSDMVKPALDALSLSKSQLRQDIFALAMLKFMRGGFFVEFGATNGVDLSNSYLLENKYDWRGIVAEPAHCWHKALRKNRKCHIETDCVWSSSGESLDFNEVNNAEISTLVQFNSCDLHAKTREQGKTYKVNTISLTDLLAKYHAPRSIDYLSIDTEGSEYEILSAFDFDLYDIAVITVEHNYGPMINLLKKLLTAKGYVQCCESISECDVWYVRPDLVAAPVGQV